jgi:integrase
VHIKYRQGGVLLSEINIPRVKKLLALVTSDTRVNVRNRARLGGEGTARKVARVLSAILSWSVDHGQLARNPLLGSLRLSKGDGVRETVLTKPEEYARLFRALDALVAEGNMRPVARAFLVVAALTGMRRGELQGLRWGDVNLAERRITLTNSKGRNWHGAGSGRRWFRCICLLPPRWPRSGPTVRPTTNRFSSHSAGHASRSIGIGCACASVPGCPPISPCMGCVIASAPLR